MKPIKKTIKNIVAGLYQKKKIEKSKKEYFSLQKRQKYEVRKCLKQKLKEFISYARSYSLDIDNIVLHRNRNKNSEKQVKLKFESNKIDNNIVSTIQKAKDEICLSDLNYQRFRKYFSALPSLHYVRKSRYLLNASFFKTYRNKYGSYNDCERKICYIIEKHIDNMKIENNTIIVKLSGDGTICGKRNKILNFTFTLPQMICNVAKSVNGNFILGVFKIQKEDYQTLKESLYECSQNLNEFSKKEITIKDKIFKIKMLLGGDMKFLHLMMGLASCNSNNSCLICKISKKDYFRNNKELIKTNLRSVEDLKKNIQDINLGDINKGYKTYPILQFIDFEDVVFDTLHLLLRISEKLLQLLFNQIKIMEADSKSNVFQERFFKYLESIGIKNPYKYEKSSSNESDKMILVLRSFNGNECLKAIQNMDLDANFPEFLHNHTPSLKDISKLFRDFYDIFMKIKQNFYRKKIDLLEIDTNEWLNNFNNCFHSSMVTPYIHLFSSHLCFFVEKFGDIDSFNISGLEKLNDQTTIQYFKATNKGKYFTSQLLAQRNRLDDYRHFGVELKLNKRIYFNIKDVKNEIFKSESLRTWCEYKFKNIRLSNIDIRKIGSGQISEKVR